MKKVEEKKRKITITLSPDILILLDDKTSNRSNYVDNLLLEYFNKLGEDVSKIKL